MSDPIRTARPDTSAISTLLRRYAHFEGDVPATPAPPETATPAGTNGGTGEEKKFTQADVDFHANKRAKDATEAARKKLLAELGIEDADADKELLAAARKRKADEQTAAEKALDDLGKEKAKREKAEQEYADFKAATEAKERATRLSSAVKDALTVANAKADKVLALLQVQHADALATVLKEDGTVDAKKVADLVEVARKAWPEDFGTRGVGTGSHSGGRTPQAGADVEKRAAITNQRTIRG